MSVKNMSSKQKESSWKQSWRHQSTAVYCVMLLMSLIALIVSFCLSSDTLKMAAKPNIVLPCDINATLSCSDVAASWQADFIHLFGMHFPNSFFGICFEAVFVTIAVLGLSHNPFPRWFIIATWWGGLGALLYSYWLLSQELYVINALCPWCLTLMFSITIQFMSITHATVVIQDCPHESSRIHRFMTNLYRPNLDLFIDVLWILFLCALILLRDGSRIFAH